MSEAELPLYDSGIIVMSAKSEMWCVKIGDHLKASSSFKNLQKYFINPKAQVGCFVKVKWLESRGINRCKFIERKIFVDLLTGVYCETTSRVWTDINLWESKSKQSKEAPIKKAIDHLLHGWRVKFRKNHL